MVAKSRILRQASVGVLAAALSSPAFAQAAGDGNEIDALIVTARKRAENVQDVPAVVTALGADTLRNLGGATDTRELIQFIPGVTFIDAASKANAEPNIRGAGQARLPNSDAAIGLYRDGAYIPGGNIGGRTFQRFDLFDIERVETLKGPQGALYGRNAVGGAINAITRAPQFDSEGELTVSYGDRRTLGLQGVVNLPATETLAFRFGADHTHQTGCIYRKPDGSCFNYQKYAAVRGAARWKPTEQLEIVAIADYADNDSDSGGVVLTRSTMTPIGVAEVNARSQLTSSQSNFNLSVRYDLGWAELYSTTNHRRRKADWYTDPDGLTTATQQDLRTDKARTTFHETRLQGETERLNWLVGADLFYLKDDYNVRERGRAPIVNTMTMTSVDPNSDLNTLLDAKSYGVYGSLEFAVTEQLKVSGEVRHSWDSKKGEIRAVRVDGQPRYVDFPVGSPQAMPDLDFENTSWGVTGSYQWTPDILTFARVATAYRSGGFNSELGNPCNSPGEVPGTSCNLVDVPFTYDPETSITYELGLKSAWFDQHVILNANVYRIEYEDLLANLNNGIPPMMDPLNGAMFLANAGDAKANGVEIDLTVRAPLPPEYGRLSGTVSYGHQSGHFKQPPAFLTTVAAGNELARLRDSSVTGNVIWSKPIVDRWTLIASINVRHEDGGFQAAENDAILDDYTVWGGRVAVENANWSFAVTAKNIFDERYFINQSGTSLGNGLQDNYRLNDPRYVEAAISYRW
ncbi:MAG: TonB-dependent receptor [Phenylobacterium sp.]|uniref:TonB-dependent receptor n=1 Tax=Phenylobacterium sp. TaxID=1871053 RepID=UPI001A4EB09E|nr:TonB-dependent receptor [Phenylobacterium sp.]MBL8554122.1 TonB-dependent receptor [Phenylobacterium sp.]